MREQLDKVRNKFHMYQLQKIIIARNKLTMLMAEVDMLIRKAEDELEEKS